MIGLAIPLLATEQIAIDHFNYLNNDEAPAIIDSTEAQDLLNVEISRSGKSVKKRSGYGSYKTLSGGQAIHGGYHFFDASGNDIQVWGSSTSLWGIVADATPVQLISSATLNSTWDCADSQGFAYCANSSRNMLTKTNGATQTWSASPLGTMVAITPERLLVAGIAAAPNTIYYSAASDFTNFTVGVNPENSSTEQIASPGSRLTHIEYGCGRWLWWKDQSFGYVLGTDQTNLKIVTVSNQIGTRDNSSAIDPNGNVYFRAQDGHIYKYDCTSLAKLTQEITPTIQTSGSRTSNSYIQTTQADWESGTTSPSGYVSTSITPGAVVLSTSIALITQPSFEAGPDNSPPTVTGWTVTRSNFYPQARACTNCVVSVPCGSPSPYSGSYYFLGSLSDNTHSQTVQLLDGSSNVIQTNTISNTTACSWTNGYIVNNSSVSATVKLRITLTNTFGTTTVDSNSFTWPGGVQFWYIVSDATENLLLLDNFITFASTGIYVSPVVNKPNVTTWDTFNVTANADGTQTYYLRASTNSFSASSSTPAWTAQTSGQVISISTGVYFQFRDVISRTTPSANPILNDFTINWFEGSASDKAYATYFDDAIWWGLAYGAGQTTNNYIFKYDLTTPGWTLFDIGVGGFLNQNNALYFGSSTSGALYRYGESTSDNGVAISAYWKSKDFPGTDPWLENSYNQLDTFAQRDQNSTLTVGYSLNASTTTTSYSMSLSSSTDDTIRHKKLLPSGKIGGLINVKYSDSSATSAWEILGFRVKYDPLPYRPTQ